MRIKQLIASTTIIGMSTALLWHFSIIWRYGQYLVVEPNIVIRSFETAIIISIFAFGVSKFVDTLRGRD